LQPYSGKLFRRRKESAKTVPRAFERLYGRL